MGERSVSFRLPEEGDGISKDTVDTFRKAADYSSDIIARATAISNSFLDEQGLDPKLTCISVTGSIGRFEALAASDMDLIPIWLGEKLPYEDFKCKTVDLRRRLQAELSIDVSTPHRLMSCVRLPKLLSPKRIGRDGDKRRFLTQRVLLLTESADVGGTATIGEVRRHILEMYAGINFEIRTAASRHPLAACNDIARLFRTMCIDYKSRSEVEPEEWGYQNVKLRGARKFWYFSTLMAVSALFARDRPCTSDLDDFLEIFAMPPVSRLLSASSKKSSAAIGKAIEEYAFYLQVMSDKKVRSSLKRLVFEKRLESTLPCGATNPFPELHESSKRLHKAMIGVLESSDSEVREQALDWFFL